MGISPSKLRRKKLANRRPVMDDVTTPRTSSMDTPRSERRLSSPNVAQFGALESLLHEDAAVMEAEALRFLDRKDDLHALNVKEAGKAKGKTLRKLRETYASSAAQELAKMVGDGDARSEFRIGGVASSRVMGAIFVRFLPKLLEEREAGDLVRSPNHLPLGLLFASEEELGGRMRRRGSVMVKPEKGNGEEMANESTVASSTRTVGRQERAEDLFADRSTDRAEDLFADRSTDRAEDLFADRSTDRAEDLFADRSTDRAEDLFADRSSNVSVSDEPSPQSKGRGDRAADLFDDQPYVLTAPVEDTHCEDFPAKDISRKMQQSPSTVSTQHSGSEEENLPSAKDTPVKRAASPGARSVKPGNGALILPPLTSFLGRMSQSRELMPTERPPAPPIGGGGRAEDLFGDRKGDPFARQMSVKFGADDSDTSSDTSEQLRALLAHREQTRPESGDSDSCWEEEEETTDESEEERPRPKIVRVPSSRTAAAGSVPGMFLSTEGFAESLKQVLVNSSPTRLSLMALRELEAAVRNRGESFGKCLSTGQKDLAHWRFELAIELRRSLRGDYANNHPGIIFHNVRRSSSSSSSSADHSEEAGEGDSVDPGAATLKVLKDACATEGEFKLLVGEPVKLDARLSTADCFWGLVGCLSPRETTSSTSIGMSMLEMVKNSGSQDSLSVDVYRDAWEEIWKPSGVGVWMLGAEPEVAKAMFASLSLLCYKRIQKYNQGISFTGDHTVERLREPLLLWDALAGYSPKATLVWQGKEVWYSDKQKEMLGGKFKGNPWITRVALAHRSAAMHRTAAALFYWAGDIRAAAYDCLLRGAGDWQLALLTARGDPPTFKMCLDAILEQECSGRRGGHQFDQANFDPWLVASLLLVSADSAMKSLACSVLTCPENGRLAVLKSLGVDPDSASGSIFPESFGGLMSCEVSPGLMEAFRV
ncbi:hypothetical protein FOL47_008622, partial [Perkinsus chesapeaki]